MSEVTKKVFYEVYEFFFYKVPFLGFGYEFLCDKCLLK